MQWDENELDTQFTPNVYIWTSNSEILAKALCHTLWSCDAAAMWNNAHNNTKGEVKGHPLLHLRIACKEIKHCCVKPWIIDENSPT